MKKVIFGILLSLSLTSKTWAINQFFQAISSATYYSLAISSSAGGTRVDNFNGSGSGLMTNRAEIIVQNLDTTDAYCAYTADVSTLPTSANQGRILASVIYTSSTVNVPISSLVPYHCQTTRTTTTGRVHVIQHGPR